MSVRDENVYVEDTDLLPEYKIRHLGSTATRQLPDEVANRELLVRLRVFRSDLARRLHERFGFEIEAETEHPYQMIANRS